MMNSSHTTVEYNCIIWMTGLCDEELNSSKRVSDDLDVLCLYNNISYFSDIIICKKDFEYYIDRLCEAALVSKLKPILNLDFHGSDVQGISISRSSEFISWEELFYMLRKLNKATEGNLFVVCSSCFGLNVIKQIKLTEYMPFAILIAAKQKTTFGYVEDNILPFYQKLLQSADIFVSYDYCLKNEFQFVVAENILFRSLTCYVYNYCLGAAYRQRKEDLVTDYVNLGGKNVNLGRKFIKEKTGKKVDILKKYSQSFLNCDQTSFNFKDVVDEAVNILKKNQNS
ncbi:hypothetical protein [Cobetia sp. 5-11-6-3]|uniref:hypothetical protein n=1 Tax=Cobetia sp. 5-11-6-3 TaxID=2737458 RepID=UPI0015971815|nr:hypothetical protein [Cobetia sp. 5-11-6-3]